MKSVITIILMLLASFGFAQNVQSRKDSLKAVRVQEFRGKDRQDSLKLQTFVEKFVSKISIRQSFQGKAEKEEAAYANIVDPSGKKSSYNYSLAIGYDLFPGDMVLSPFIEAQKNTLSEKEQNVFLTGLEAQFGVNAEQDDAAAVSYLIAKANYKKDQVKKTEGAQASLYYTLSVNAKGPGVFYPLPDVYNDFGWLRFVYNPYAGIEYENRYQAKADRLEGSTTRLHLRVAASIYPLSRLLSKRLEIIPDFTYRKALSNSTSAEKDENHIFKIDFNIIVFKKKIADKNVSVKFGVNYTKGVDPTKGFEDQEVMTYAIKLKI